MIIQQINNVLPWAIGLGFIFILMPFAVVIYFKAHRFGFTPRFGKKDK